MPDILDIRPDANPAAKSEAPEPRLRILAECSDYDSLVHALRVRVRVRERRIVLSELDIVTGLADRYSSKLLSPNPATSSPKLGLVSLGPALAAPRRQVAGGGGP